MTAKYASHVSTRVTPQSEPIPGKPQVANSAGGYSFAVDCWTRLERFLILGCEGGSYYASERKLTQENAQCVRDCAALDAKRTVQAIVDVSLYGRAPKNDPAIFALAMLSKDEHALKVMPQVCRTGTHLFQFVEAAQQFRGWGRSLRKAVAAWYEGQSGKQLAYQLTKYQQRNGWSHRDVLRKCHAHPMTWDGATDEVKSLALRWAVGKADFFSPDLLPCDAPLAMIAAMEHAKRATTKQEVVRLIREYGLVRECIPTKWLNELEVWDAMLDGMPLTALIRNLGKMTAIELVKPMSAAAGKICVKLADVEHMKNSRLHPLAILVAMKVYAQGHGAKGKLNWNPDGHILNCLDGAFYSAFGNVEPTGKRWFLGCDVSGSMSNACAGTVLECREAVAAMALVTARTEPNYVIAAFSDGLQTVDFSRMTRLDYAVRKMAEIPMGGTDCSLPMVYALQHKIPVDVFVVLTDSETWCGSIHPCQALQKYREKMGIPAKLIVAAFTSNEFSIADPADAGMLDVVGFDTAIPQVMADFATH